MVAVTDSSLVASQPQLAEALGVIHMLAGEIGPRRPCSDAEKDAANRLTAWLHDRGVEARIEEFEGYPSFAAPYAALFTASLAGGLLQRSRRRGVRRAGTCSPFPPWCPPRSRGTCAGPRCPTGSQSRPSVNVLAHVPSAGPTRRRVCLCGHLDTTRSGLMFHPRLARHLAALLQVPAASGWRLRPGRCCGGSPAAARSTAPRSRVSPSRSRCCSSASGAGRTSRAPATTPQERPSRCSWRPSARRARSTTQRSTS